MESGVEFVAVDMPEANRLTIHILAAVAEHEREMISVRTRAALQAAKARGIRLGAPDPTKGSVRGVATIRARAAARAQNVAPVIESIRAAGATSLRAIADALRRVRTPAPPHCRL
jgi:DNA invertase Pin-like site-specific DNA recombinase